MSIKYHKYCFICNSISDWNNCIDIAAKKKSCIHDFIPLNMERHTLSLRQNYPLPKPAIFYRKIDPLTIYGSLNTGISVLNSLFNISSIPCINPIPSIPCYSQFCVRSYLSMNIDAPNHTKEYIDDVSLYANIIQNLLCLISPWYFTRVKYAKPYGIRQIFVCLAICAPEYLLSITWPINPLANDRLVLLAPPWLHEIGHWTIKTGLNNVLHWYTTSQRTAIFTNRLRNLLCITKA